ncbi:MAG: hypothetical protein QOI12_2848 [Alphaproteobacteria bacterium]|nr:hypothetical protein [Alphaproteobacteria bacterium]
MAKRHLVVRSSEPRPEDTISLYFKLKDGQKADLEIVAAAALEWVAAVRAAARDLAPEAQIRVELIDASESSLKLNTIFDWIEGQLKQIEKGSGRYPRLKKLALALAIFIPTTGAQTITYWFGPQQVAVLSTEDRKLLEDNKQLMEEMLGRVRKNPEVEIKRQQFFKLLERDSSITGAGISEGRSRPPLIMIPSNQFAERSGLWVPAEETDEHVIYPIVDVTLIAPMLVPVPRSWRFQPTDGLPEFGAVMRDKSFLAALEHDHVKESLRVGIRMTLRLAIKEYNVGGVWLVRRGGRSVVQVISPKVD